MSKNHSYIRKNSPPSSYAIAAVIEGEKGGWPRTIGQTLQRSLFIAPGLALAGIKGPQLIKGSIYSSATITGFLFGLYILRKKGVLKI